MAYEACRRKARALQMWDAMLSDSQLTEEDAVKAGNEAKEAILRRLGWE